MVYIEYSLLNLDGRGHQPYAAVAAAGATLQGGLYVQNGRYCGILNGTEDQVQAAIAGMAPYGVRVMEADEWATRSGGGS